MGGPDTEVTGGTTASCSRPRASTPRSVRRTARRLGLHSEASHRFERGVDPELASWPRRAPPRSCAARRRHRRRRRGRRDAYPASATTRAGAVALGAARTSDRRRPRHAACRDALERLGFTVDRPSATPRFDVEPPIAARREPRGRSDRGDRAPRRLRPGAGDASGAAPGAGRTATSGRSRAPRARRAGLRRRSPSASSRRARSPRCACRRRSRAPPIALRNPMSVDQAVMRTSLLPNLLAAVARNQSYGRPDVALFEVGSVFLRARRGAPSGEITSSADEPVHGRAVLSGVPAAGSAPARPGTSSTPRRSRRGAAPRDERSPAPRRARADHPVSASGRRRASSCCDGHRRRWFGEVHPDTRARSASRRGVRVRGRARPEPPRRAPRRCDRSRGSRRRRATSRCCSPTTSRRRASRGDRRGERAARRGRCACSRSIATPSSAAGHEEHALVDHVSLARAHADRCRGRRGTRDRRPARRDLPAQRR